ncbi:hypothetical protein D4R51_03775 [bacterium]|nr:MAG: hypothetical protein D4R51_03775 [bacterium]
MSSEVRICQNCKSQFTIEPDDFSFYEKIQVPAPTFCPDCRLARKMTWRNERSLYQSKCALTGKRVISIFAPDSPVVTYDRDVWWSDQWDPLSSGRAYDFNKTFFSQFRSLLEQAPMPAIFNAQSVNSEYTNHSGRSKDCYLTFAAWTNERVLYGNKVYLSKDSLDVLSVSHVELSYEIIVGTKLYRTFFADNSESCSESHFLHNCKGCSNCFGCANLRNKNYYIFNQPYSSEEYFKKLKEADTGSYSRLEQIKRDFDDFKLKSPRKFAFLVNALNSTGENLTNVKNCKVCFDLFDDVKDCKFTINGGVVMNDIYDSYGPGEHVDLSYEIIDSGLNASRLINDIVVWGGRNILYSYNCHGCNDCFGCMGLRKKQYCILNKQYTKEEYESIVPRIIKHMNDMPYIDKKGRVYRYGEFFPPELSPFAYNETIAQEYFPLTKGEAEVQGYRWKDPDTKEYQITKQPSELPDHIRDTGDDILKETMGCLHAAPPAGGCTHQCTTAFRIIGEELSFYRRMNLPLPRLCPNCRHYERLAQRNPLKLWHRTCMCDKPGHFHKGHCSNEFETSYAPERKEVVYCEQCYNSEVV